MVTGVLSGMTSIKNLHHAAYRCRDSEETRAFYEDFLELPLVEALPISTTATGREANVLHTFYQMRDGACLAFFEAPEQPFEFKEQQDFDLHIALEVDASTLQRMFDKGQSSGIDTRGISDHGFVHSIYFRDPNGYVVELAAPTATQGSGFDQDEAHQRLAEWNQREARG
jgi:catechol 2,3-dioxygenase-like lactoylglutathione lyase family enzyme